MFLSLKPFILCQLTAPYRILNTMQLPSIVQGGVWAPMEAKEPKTENAAAPKGNSTEVRQLQSPDNYEHDAGGQNAVRLVKHFYIAMPPFSRHVP